MQLFRSQETDKLKEGKAREAIALALEKRWDKALEVNSFILSRFPDDVDAHNRLGKALIELGRYGEARDAFKRGLELYPFNTIAQKNLDRLTLLEQTPTPRPNSKKVVAPNLFIEESGKAGVISLINLAPKEVLAKMAAGDPVNLQVEKNSLIAATASGEYLGQLAPKLAIRLIRLMEGGNRYESAITSVGQSELAIIVNEAYRNPAQLGTVSFLSPGGDNTRLNARGALLRYDLADEEEEIDRETTIEWGGDDEPEPPDEAPFADKPSGEIPLVRERRLEDEDEDEE